MTNDQRRVELEILARLQSAISDSLGRLYDASRSKDYQVVDELSQAMENSDRLIFIYRAIATMIEHGTPKKFDAHEAQLIDQLTRSMKLVSSKRGLKIVPSNNPEGAA